MQRLSHPTDGSWRPLLTGDLAGQAEEAVSAIAAAIAAMTAEHAAGAGEALGARSVRQGSLGGGDLGVAHGLGGIIALLGAACGAGGPRVAARARPRARSQSGATGEIAASRLRATPVALITAVPR